jgi:hypothetical protein
MAFQRSLRLSRVERALNLIGLIQSREVICDTISSGNAGWACDRHRLGPTAPTLWFWRWFGRNH